MRMLLVAGLVSFGLVIGNDAEAQASAADSAANNPATIATPPPPDDAAAPVMKPSLGVPVQPGSSAPVDFQWRPAVTQAALFTGIMHAFRFATEAGTRDTLHGPFFRDYFDSVKELRGWDDGDGFMTSYIGHPMEGSVFAFIQIQNGRYRGLEFNQGREYWIGRLQALAFSAVWSTLWTLGPASEASLGNVQLHSSPGFVDLAGTPALGAGWGIGEDAVDRYLIARLERHTANRALLMFVRGFGNPTRTFANVIGLRVPWQRDTRPGLFGAAYGARSGRVRSRKELDGEEGRPTSELSSSILANPAGPVSHSPVYPKAAPIELTASPHYESFLSGGSCIGGGGSGAARIAPSWQLVAEVSGCLIVNMPSSQSGDSLLYVAGPRWTPRADRLVSPYSHLLFGGRKVSHDIVDSELRAKLQKEWDAGLLPHYPKRSDYSVEQSANGFALVAGGGVDINVNPVLTVRAANLEYSRSFVPQVDRIDASHGVRFSSGVVLRIGTW